MQDKNQVVPTNMDDMHATMTNPLHYIRGTQLQNKEALTTPTLDSKDSRHKPVGKKYEDVARNMTKLSPCLK